MKVVFDATAHGYLNWWFSLPGSLGLLGVAVVLGLRRTNKTRRERSIASLGVFVLSAAALAWVSETQSITYAEYRSLADALKQHRYTAVVGKVTEYHPRGFTPHAFENWMVAGHYHIMITSTVTAGFNTPGIVHSGDSVRIVDVNGTIARLEILK